jgi:predicted ribosomally synthesized peptide with SipW-like signal peptide
MSNRLYDTTQISRRKVLAGLGTIGVAAAGAGIGTSAFFSDQETFEGNSLVAGSLDMKVDWEEHYYDGAADFLQYAVPTSDVEGADYTLPALEGTVMMNDARPIALNFVGDTDEAKQGSKDELWDATSIEAMPDADDDGIQDEFDDELVCDEDILVDVGGESAGLESDKRTESSVGEPLINLADVKPGDFGEVTLSFHLCDNPGYVWINGNLVSESENGVTEPEGQDPDEIDGEVELADYIATRMWYDPNGNNQRDVVTGELDIMMALDTSGSISSTEMDEFEAGINAFVDALPTDGSVQVGSLDFGGNSLDNLVALTDPASYSPILPTSGSGNTPLPAALDVADQYLDANARPDAQKVVMVFTDGGPNYENTSYSVGSFAAPRASEPGYSDDQSDSDYEGGTGNNKVDKSEQDETANVAAAVRASGSRIVVVNVGDNPNADLGTDPGNEGRDLNNYLSGEIASSGFYFEADVDDLTTVAASLVAAIIVPEEVFFQGSLRQALEALAGNDGRGVPLDGDLVTPFEETSDPENDPDRDCFIGEGTTHYVAFQWWLPLNHANQVQSDSVSFDLGFYTEQCRHNDGAGMPPENEEEATPEEPVLTAD